MRYVMIFFILISVSLCVLAKSEMDSERILSSEQPFLKNSTNQYLIVGSSNCHYGSRCKGEIRSLLIGRNSVQVHLDIPVAELQEIECLPYPPYSPFWLRPSNNRNYDHMLNLLLQAERESRKVLISLDTDYCEISMIWIW